MKPKVVDVGSGFVEKLLRKEFELEKKKYVEIVYR